MISDATTAETTIFKARLERIHYNNNGYLIAKARLERDSRDDGKGGRRPAVWSVLGNMDAPLVGQVYLFEGSASFNDQYKSHELRFRSYRAILPNDSQGILDYLVDVAKWVGPKTAQSLVSKFGDDALDVLKNKPDLVLAAGISGLTAGRVAEMQKTLCENERDELAQIALNNLVGDVLGPASRGKAIKKWWSDAADKIKDNPYILTELSGVGWTIADAVAQKLKIELGDPRRQQAAVKHALASICANEGHTAIDINRLNMESQKLLGAPLDTRVLIPGTAYRTDSYAQDSKLHSAERSVARAINMLLAAEIPDMFLPKIDTDGLAIDQKAAVAAFGICPLFILTGAPGTGKTYTIARIVKNLVEAKLDVRLCAPTGKAAKQMTMAMAEVCPQPASTIHSLLQATIEPESGEFMFQRDATCPLELDALIIDEMSMVDTRLAANLFAALPDRCRVLIVGDHYQLPSVGPGCVLRDLLAAGVPSYELTEIKRNSGMIVQGCHAIKDGRLPQPSREYDPDNGLNYRHLPAGAPEEIIEKIGQLIQMVVEVYERNMDDVDAAPLHPVADVQIIAPTNSIGELSCDALNKLVRQILNPGPCVKGLSFRVGDKVVRCRNGVVRGRFVDDEERAGEADIPVVNGDLGIVQAVDDRSIHVRLSAPERSVSLPRSDHHLKTAYAMTCHKMQGSEVAMVILPVHKSVMRLPMVSREWLYTAFSRAKHTLITVGDWSSMSAALGRRVVRNTKLVEAIVKE